VSPRVGHAKLPARGSIATAALVVALVAGFVSIGSPASADPNNAALSAQATTLAAEVNRLELRAEAIELLSAAEQLRHESGQGHRPWELRSRDLATQLLSAEDIDHRPAERTLDFAAATARASRLLEVVREPA